MSLDAFNTSAFNTTALTAAINTSAINRTQLADLNLFEDVGLASKVFYIDQEDDVLTILDGRTRGDGAQGDGKDTRTAIPFETLHFPYVKTVIADDLVGVRQFGSEDQLQDMTTEVARILEKIKRNKYQRTWESLQMSALHGVVSYTLNGVATTVSLYTKFGVAEQTLAMLYGTTTTDIEAKCTAIRRLIENKLSGEPYNSIHVLCGPTMFDGIKGHALVRDTLKYTQPQPILDGGQRKFTFGGITWEEYVGGTDFVAADEGRAFPIGVQGLFQMAYAPGTMLEAVNTRGIPLYASQTLMKHNKGIEIYTESNPFPVCTRPAVLIELTAT